jgi:hypothetical protein
MSKGTASGALGLALASALASLCCLPIASGAVGIALAALAVAVSPWWPLLACASLVLLTVAVVQTMRGRGDVEAGHCEIQNRRQRQWLFVSVVAFLTLALLSVPWWSAQIAYRFIQ